MWFFDIEVLGEHALKEEVFDSRLSEILKIESLKSAYLLLSDQDVKKIWSQWQWNVKQKRSHLLDKKNKLLKTKP